MKTIKSIFRFFAAFWDRFSKRRFYGVIGKQLVSASYASMKEVFCINEKPKLPKFVVIGILLGMVLLHAQTPFEKYFPGTGHCVDIQPLSSGGYVSAVNFHNGGKFWLYRMTAQGDTLWTKTFPSGGDVNNRWAIRVAIASDGGYFILCGNSKQAYSCLFNTVLKTNENGDSLWQVIISSTKMWADAGFRDLIANPNDNCCVAVGHGSAGGDPRILKVNYDGKIEWETIVEKFIYSYFSSVCQSSDSGYIATGRNHNNITGLTNFLVTKFNSQGDTLWSKTYYSGLFDSGDRKKATGNSVVPTLDGGCMVAGYVTDPGIWGSSGLLMRLNASGDTLWTKKYFNPEHAFHQNVAYKLVRLPFDEYLMYVKRNDGSTSSIGTLLKIDYLGETLWSQVGYEYRLTLNKIDKEGGILFTGYGGGLLEDVAVMIRTTEGGLYESPKLIKPVNNSINVDLNPHLVWGSKHLVNSSNLQIATDSMFTKILFDINDIKKDTIQITQLASNTKYFWRVKSIDKESSYSSWSQVFNFRTITSVSVEENSEMQVAFSLGQNYPNPFNPTTKIKYSVPVVESQNLASVSLVIYDILGREVKALVNEYQHPGNYEVVFDASKLTGGVYFYRLTAGSFVETKKMLLLK